MRKNRTFAGVVAAVAVAGSMWAVTIPVSTITLGAASVVSVRLNQGASLNGASLNGASLNGASLNGASLNGASLNGASLNGASLNGASLN